MEPELLHLRKACLNGDQSAFQKLYEMLSSRMMGLCMRYMGNVNDAEDVLQEGFIKVFKHLKSYKEQGSLEGWIRKIMVNQALYQLKKRTSLYAVQDLDFANAELSHDESALEKMSATELVDMIRLLPPAYRTVFNLYAIEGFTHKEIGQMLGVSEGTSKSNLSDARRHLKKKISVMQKENIKKRA